MIPCNVRPHHRLLALALSFFLTGCGGTREDYVFTAPSVAQRALSGTVSYQRLLPLSDIQPDDGEFGRAELDFANPQIMPCRYIRVQLLDEENQLLGQTHTDDRGNYSFESVTADGPVKIRALAESVKLGDRSASIRVQDNTKDGRLYAAESSPVNLAEIAVLDLDIPTGYDTSGEQPPDTVRSSAPFSCLDGILTGYRYFLAGGMSSDELPICIVNWSQDNRPEGPAENETQQQALADGRIGTSHFSSETNQLAILGFREADTDEFDWHIMVHEFGHWVQYNAFRDNNTGGSHNIGESKDPRLAFSEGVGNALGGLALGDGVYKDTNAAEGFGFSLECNLSQGDPNPGWYSEATVQTIIFDLFDPKREEAGDSQFPDRIELPRALFVAALLKQAESPSLTTIFSFLSGLVKSGLSPEQMTELLALLAYQSPSVNFGLNSLDEFGAGETHDARRDSLPVYGDATPFFGVGLIPLTLPGQPQEGVYNSLEGVRFFKFLGDGSTVSVTAHNSTSTVGAVYLEVFEDGRAVSRPLDDEVEDEEGETDDNVDLTVSVATKVGSTYVVVFINTDTDTSTTDIQFSRI